MSCFAQLATPDSQGLRFGHVHLNVSNINAHLDIWTTHFGGQLIQNDKMTAIQYENFFVIFNQQVPVLGSRETVMDHFGFKVRDIDAFLEAWTDANLEAGNIFTGAEGQSNAYVTLPDGVYVELQEDQALAQSISGYHVHLYTPEPEKLLDWYAEVFNIDIKPRGSIGTTTNVPGQNISFAKSRGQRGPSKGSSIDHIGFEVDDLEDFMKKLVAKGVIFDQPLQSAQTSGLKSAVFTDPAGTLIELTEGLYEY